MIAKPNVEGEIIHRGTGTMIGYLGDRTLSDTKIKPFNPVPINKDWDSDVVFTGDYGRIDDEGYLYVLGRKDGMLKISGYRVYPKEIEDSISAHPDVKNVAVIGIPDVSHGKKIIAEIIVSKGGNEKDIISFLKKNLPDYMIPWKVTFVDHLPLTSSGKIQYHSIKEKYLD